MALHSELPIYKTGCALLKLALHVQEQMPAADLFTTGNSYLGLLRQASHSHHHRAQLANAMRRRGHSVNGALTKTYRTKDYA